MTKGRGTKPKRTEDFFLLVYFKKTIEFFWVVYKIGTFTEKQLKSHQEKNWGK